MEIGKGAISKISIVDDVISSFNSQDFESELEKIPPKLTLLFPFPGAVSIKLSLEDNKYGSNPDEESFSLFKDEVSVNGNKKLQFEVLISKKHPKYDFSLEKSLFYMACRDIGKQVSTEYKRRDLENSFNQFFDNSPDEIFVHDLDGKIININQNACNRLGYSKEELLMKTPELFEVDDQKKMFSQRMKKVFKEGKLRFESAQITKSGKKIDVEINAVIATIQGKPVVFSIVRDITERRNKDRQIHKAYSLLDNVVKTGIVSFWEIDIESGTVGFDFGVDDFGFFTNRFAEEYNDFLEIIHPNDRELVSEELKKCIEGKKDICQATHKGMSNSGEWEWFQSIGYVVEKDFNGAPKSINGLSININEKKKVEQDMKTAYERLQQALMAGELLWWELELPEGKMNFDADMFRKFGYQQKGLENFSFNDFLKIIHPDDHQKIFEGIIDCVKNRYKSAQIDYRVDIGDGKWIWHTVRGKVVEADKNGNRIKLSGVIKNINKRKLAEVKLTEAKVAAELSNRAKTEFLATMSHELRTPLNSVIVSPKYLLMEDTGNLIVSRKNT
ncbi:PAS domain S-box-containing protein [Methanohalophilus levihalophilus]|nr:PAS domain S-box protein [Methanohalophilus levihalophilus]MBP2029270.1 PAS domain S-box-containing protein [Methanohalophilus levihalophilus]